MNALVSGGVFLEGCYPNIALLGACLLKSLCIVVLAGGCAAFLRGRSARARCWVWRCALMGAALLLAVEFGPPVLRRLRPVVPVRPAAGEMAAFARGAQSLGLLRSPDEISRIIDRRQAEQRMGAARPLWEIRGEVLLTVAEQRPAFWAVVERGVPWIWWAGAAGLILAQMVRAGAGVLWLERAARDADAGAFRLAREVGDTLGIGRVPRVRIVRTLSSPLLIGLRRPGIFLPEACGAWDEAKLRPVFLHELSHWKRRDHLWRHFGNFISALWWWNPLAGWAARRMGAEAEQAADDTVVLNQTSAPGYAETLMEVAAASIGKPPPVGLSMIGYSPLEQRIRAILSRNPMRGRIGATAGLLLAILGVAIAGAASIRAVRADPQNSMKTEPGRATIQLTIRDAESGRPLAGAAVKVTEYPKESVVSLVTDAAGRCVALLSEARPPRIRVRVVQAGYVAKFVDWDTENPEFALPAEFTLKLDKARSIGGIVVDETGAPIAGAEVSLIIRWSSSGASQQIHNDIWEERVKTDVQGRWAFHGAPASLEPLSVRLSHPDFISNAEPRTLPERSEFSAHTAILVMEKGRRIEGIVRDTSGRPLPGVAVWMHEHGSDSTTKPEFATGVDGRFVIPNAPQETPGARAGGLVLTFFKKSFAPELSVVARESSPAALDVTLDPGRRLTGRVTDPSGAPVPGVSICPDYWRGARPFCLRFETDKDGRFVWEDAPVDEVIFDILKQGFMARRGVRMRAADGEHTLVIKRPITVTGRVVDADTGEPIPAFEISEGLLWSRLGRNLSSAPALAGKDGAFAWTFSEPSHLGDGQGGVTDEGAHFLRIRVPGYLPGDSRPIRDSEDSVALTFQLAKGKETPVTVRTRDHASVEGAAIVVAGEGNAVMIENGAISPTRDKLTMMTGAAGSAVLPPLPGNPMLVIAHPDFGFATATLEEAGRGAITLTGWAKVIVKSADIRRGDPPPFYLNYEPLDASPPEEHPPLYRLSNRPVVTGDGALVFTGVKPGAARVGRYRHPDRDAITVQAPENGEVTVSIEPARD